ncbi:hypothetical protein [Enhygromyxa salina]|uniref:hypothetical protein n=1 Tax=Enhygromyxa salina TaxID=215803 RepID=UPI0011B209C7|nr:hypothetical protein [Enhygromyxa salina]
MRAVDRLAVGWYDASRPDPVMELLCESSADWMHAEDEEMFSCTVTQETVHVVDPNGVAAWTVQHGAMGKQSGAPRLIPNGTSLPQRSMPVLVMPEPPPAADARILPVSVSSPSDRAKAATAAVAKAVAAIEHEVHDASELPMTAMFEIIGSVGSFGGKADTLVVYEVEDSSADWVGSQVLVALADQEVVGVFGTPPLSWYHYQAVGATDLDGDGVQEVLWWARADGVGVGLNLTYFAGGAHHETNLFSCQCGEAFKSVYR